jgi:hypothetical protein
VIIEGLLLKAFITKVVAPKVAVLGHHALAAKVAATGHATLATHAPLLANAVSMAPDGAMAAADALGSASAHSFASSLVPLSSFAHPAAVSTLHSVVASGADSVDWAELGGDLLEILGGIGAGVLAVRSGRDLVEAAHLHRQGDHEAAKKALKSALKGGRPLKSLVGDWHLGLDAAPAHGSGAH